MQRAVPHGSFDSHWQENAWRDGVGYQVLPDPSGYQAQAEGCHDGVFAFHQSLTNKVASLSPRTRLWL
jgi:hypothetical protein